MLNNFLVHKAHQKEIFHSNRQLIKEIEILFYHFCKVLRKKITKKGHCIINVENVNFYLHMYMAKKFIRAFRMFGQMEHIFVIFSLFFFNFLSFTTNWNTYIAKQQSFEISSQSH